jgi:hypothetical protein
MKRFVLVACTGFLLSACAGGAMTTREKGALGGAALGAGTGAIIGSATGKAGTGALIGAGIGALGGAAVGDAIQGTERRPEPLPPSPAAPPPGGVLAPSPAPSQVAVADPTRGQLVNATRWRLSVYVNVPPEQQHGPATFTLNPQESVPANLDIGQHRITAAAFVDTQFGPRQVGRYDRTIQIDPRGSGWSLRLAEIDFQ